MLWDFTILVAYWKINFALGYPSVAFSTDNWKCGSVHRGAVCWQKAFNHRATIGFCFLPLFTLFLLFLFSLSLSPNLPLLLFRYFLISSLWLANCFIPMLLLESSSSLPHFFSRALNHRWRCSFGLQIIVLQESSVFLYTPRGQWKFSPFPSELFNRVIKFLRLDTAITYIWARARAPANKKKNQVRTRQNNLSIYSSIETVSLAFQINVTWLSTENKNTLHFPFSHYYN